MLFLAGYIYSLSEGVRVFVSIYITDMSVKSMFTKSEIMETTRNGVSTYRLVCADLMLRACFDEWVYKRAKSKKRKRPKVYAYAVKGFINYIEVVELLFRGLTPKLYADALDAYESYLVFGIDSESEIARKVAAVLQPKKLKGSSVRLYFAAVNSFLAASESAHIGMGQLQDGGYISDLAISPLAEVVGQSRPTTSLERAAIKSKSWFAGCVAGGARKVKRTHLSAVSKLSSLAHTDNSGGDDLAFPIDKCAELIASATCLRDAVLWSFLAASGCRISEALTLQRDDIVLSFDDASFKKVYIVDPASRRDVLSRHLPESTIDQISHKGRQTTDTWLIEPFASMFWIALNDYMVEQQGLEKKRLRPVFHNFLFRNLRNGKPMPTSYQTVWERFKVAALKVTGRNYGFHSLRHMYGYYLLNHCPNPMNIRQFGMDLKSVQHLMGHASIQSTERYARRDAKMLGATFSAINMLRMSASNFSVQHVQIKHLENEVESMKAELKREKPDAES